MNTESDPDAELMLRLKNGEDVVLNELMTRWQGPLVAFIYRYIGRQNEALDLAQETFVRIFETRHRYTVRGKFSTWLFTIAANLCRNYLRWRQKQGEPIPETWETDEGECPESHSVPEESPDQAAIRSESISLIRAAINKLPHDLKTAILLFEYDGLSYAELSSVLGCSVKAAEMKLYRARQLLRESLSPRDFQ
jgi:RNA polymerase sigma-70 factor, ECF subfamily